MLSAPFWTLDDKLSILDNAQIQSLKNIPIIFKTSFFGASRYYRPLVTLSFALNYRWFGFNPFFFNLTNLFLHLLVSLLVFKAAAFLLKDKTLGFLTAFLFVAHPINAEAVSHIAGRSILLCAFFEWSSFILYCMAREKKRVALYILSLICFCCALLSKESSAMLLGVLLAYEFFFKNSSLEPVFKKAKNVFPFLIILLIYIAARKILGIISIPYGFTLGDTLLGVATFLTSVFSYLRIFIFPADLYSERIFILQESFLSPFVLATLALLGAGLFVLIKLRKHIKKEIIFFLSFIVLTLFPVSQIVPLRLQPGYIFFPDHFWYVPSVGVFALLVTLGVFVSRRTPSIIFKMVVGIWIVVLLSMTVQQNIYATNETASFKKVLFYQPTHAWAHTIMGMKSVKQEDFKKAEHHFRQTLESNPFDVRARISLGKTLIDQGRYWEGLNQYDQIADAENLETMLKDNKAKTYKILQDKYEQMLKEDSNNEVVYYSLGVVYSKKGEFKEAAALYRQALSLDPGINNARQNLCHAYHMLGEEGKAKECLNGILP